MKVSRGLDLTDDVVERFPFHFFSETVSHSNKTRITIKGDRGNSKKLGYKKMFDDGGEWLPLQENSCNFLTGGE